MPKIPSLPPGVTLAADDEFPAEDTSASTTKRWTMTMLKNWLISLADWITASMVSATFLIYKGIHFNYFGTLATLLTTSYATYATVTATTAGGRVILRAVTEVQDGSSGSARSGTFKIDCDGVDVTNAITGWRTNTSSNLDRVNSVIQVDHTPSAGSHTWRIRGIAATGSATYIVSASLTVDEVNT